MPYDDFARAVVHHYSRPDLGSRARPPINWPRHIGFALLTIATMSLGHHWTFVAALFAILLAHELGHYVACRVYDVDASLPYFLPGPPLAAIFGPVAAIYPGTFGAFIRIREPMPHRKALFDIGIAGPLAGFVVILLLLPAAVMEIEPLPDLGPDVGGLPNPLLFGIAVPLMRGFPDSTPYEAGPIFIAIWVGCLATFLNLIPIGQLDGGHVVYALFGRRVNRFSLVLLAMLWLFVAWFPSFALLALLVTIFGPRHPPLLSEREGIGPVRVAVAILGLAILVVCFIPLPYDLFAPQEPAPELPRPDRGMYVRHAAPPQGPAPSGAALELVVEEPARAALPL